MHTTPDPSIYGDNVIVLPQSFHKRPKRLNSASPNSAVHHPAPIRAQTGDAVFYIGDRVAFTGREHETGFIADARPNFGNGGWLYHVYMPTGKHSGTIRAARAQSLILLERGHNAPAHDDTFGDGGHAA